MSMTRICAALSLLLLTAAPTFQAAAHTTVASSTPPSGSTLEQSPPVIELKFHGAINLTSVVVIDAGKAERKIDFTPHASATVFQVPNPQLAPGKSEVKWTGLSKDGHVVTGSLAFEVKPKEPKAP
jgi:methionine-rich copper-binding protein CopC